MTSTTSQLDSYTPYTGEDQVVVGNGANLRISHTGTRSLSKNIHLLDVLVVPHNTKNLLSISKLTSDHPVDVVFTDKSFLIQNPETKGILAQGRRDNGLYILERGHSGLFAALHSKSLKASYELWHSRLGHVSFSTISLLHKLGHLYVTALMPKPTICSPCLFSKSKRLSFSINEKRASFILELVHCDLWGPAPVQSINGYNYYVIFIDDYSRFTWIYPMHRKSDFFGILKHFHAFVSNQFSHTPKTLQSDGGGEFINASVSNFLREHGIQHHISCPYTPAQNGRAERKHRHVTETGLAMMFNAQAPSQYWFDAFSAATYTINRLPSAVLQGKTSFELLFGLIPNYTNFHPFGCRVFPCLHHYATHKLMPRSAPCIFLGYSCNYKGFRCLDLVTSRVYITRHAQFDESCFPFSGNFTNGRNSQLDFSSFIEPPISSPVIQKSIVPTPTVMSPATPCSLCPESPVTNLVHAHEDHDSSSQEHALT